MTGGKPKRRAHEVENVVWDRETFLRIYEESPYPSLTAVFNSIEPPISDAYGRSIVYGKVPPTAVRERFARALGVSPSILWPAVIAVEVVS